MSLIYPLSRRPVLADLLPRVSSGSFAGSATLVLAGAALTSLVAQIAIPVPGSPVPVTGQTFAVLITAAALGPLRGVLSQAVYLLAGIVGLPVFTQGHSGIHEVTGVNGGYLVGFLVASLIVGYGSRRGSDRSAVRELAVVIAAEAVIYLFGAPWLAHQTGMGFSATMHAGVTPFLFGDALKAALAAGLLPGAWKLVDKATSR